MTRSTFTHIVYVLASLFVGFSILFAVYKAESLFNKPVGGDSVLPGGLTTYNIAGSGVSSSATSITLASLTIPQTGQKLIDSDFSDTFYLTVDPGNRTRQEFVSCTTVAQNAAGTATLSGCSRGLAPVTPYTASTSLQFAHSGGAQIIFSNSPQFYNQFTAKGNDEVITGIWTAPSPTESGQLATKGYADSLSAAGVATATASNFGGVWLGTQTRAASSTIGEPNTPYVLLTSMSTDTPNTATRASRVVMSDMTGYLKQGWLNLTETFGFAKITATEATSTNLAVSGSSLMLNGVRYSFPSSFTAASSTVWKMKSDGTVIYDFAGQKLYTTIPVPIGATSTPTSLTGYTTNTTAYIWGFNLPGSMTVNKISIKPAACGTPGSYKLGIYSADGQTQMLSTTTKTLTANTLDTSTLASAITLEQGDYWFVLVPNGTVNCDLMAWYYYGDGFWNQVVGEPVMSGTTAVTASTLPTSFTPSSLSGNNNAVTIRLDN